MAQFDVHRNPGRQRDSIPYVVIVQSTLYVNYRRRVVVPLVNKSSLGKIANPRFSDVSNQRSVGRPASARNRLRREGGTRWFAGGVGR